MNNLSWWCSATDAPWSWIWRPYPGVWLAVLLLLVGYHRALARTIHGVGWIARARQASVLGGILVIWLATDWPLGALGAGYLLSIHTVSFVLLALIAPPMLLLGWPAPAAPADSGVRRAIAWVTRPIPALALFNVVLLVTHLPPVIDGLMPLQLGAFAIDLAWVLAGLVYWSPVVRPGGNGVLLSYPKRMLYLFGGTILPTVPAAFMTFSDYPIYGLYELAPRVAGITAKDDQQVAGLTMKIIGDLPFWLGFGVVFFRWAREESEGDRRSKPGPEAPQPTG